MARHCDSGIHFEIDTGAIFPAGDLPWTVFMWVMPKDTGIQRLWYAGTKTNNTQYFACQTQGFPKIYRFQARNTTSRNADTINAAVVDKWQSVCCRNKSTTDRDIVVDGDFANKGSNTTSVTFPVENRFSVGRWGRSTPAATSDMEFAEVAVWGVALADGEVTQLDQGFSPLHIRPESLTNYWRMIGDRPQVIDRIEAFHLLETGTSASVPHPPIIYPATRMISFPPVVAAPVAADNAPLFGMNF